MSAGRNGYALRSVAHAVSGVYQHPDQCQDRATVPGQSIAPLPTDGLFTGTVVSEGNCSSAEQLMVLVQHRHSCAVAPTSDRSDSSCKWLWQCVPTCMLHVLGAHSGFLWRRCCAFSIVASVATPAAMSYIEAQGNTAQLRAPVGRFRDVSTTVPRAVVRMVTVSRWQQSGVGTAPRMVARSR